MAAINQYNFLRWENKGLTGSNDGGILYKLSTVFETDPNNNNQYEPNNIDLNLYYGATLDQDGGKSRITCPAPASPSDPAILFLDTDITSGSTLINRKLVIKLKVNYGACWPRIKRSSDPSSTYYQLTSSIYDSDITTNGVRLQYVASTNIWTITIPLNTGVSLTMLTFNLFPINSGVNAALGTQIILEDVELDNLDFVPVSADFDEITLLPHYNPKARGQMAPILVPGESTSFYLNTAIGITEDLVLHIINANTLASVANIGTVSKLEFAEGFHFYHTFVNPAITSGYYKLGLYQDATLALCSNDIFVMTSKYDEVSVRFKFRHNSNMYGFNYDRILTFYQQLRLPIIESESQFNYDIDQYKSSTSRKNRNYFNNTERYRKFDALYFDELAHEAAAVMVEHDEIYINEKKYTFKSGYKINEDPISRVSKGEFELFEDKIIDDKFAQLTVIS